MKLVWRTRNAGVCSTSTTAATSAIGVSSWTSVSTGTPICRLTSASMRRPSSMPGPRKLVARRAIGLVVRRLEDERDAELARELAQLAGDVDHQRLGLDDARTRNQEQRLGRARLRNRRVSCAGGNRQLRGAVVACRAHEAREERMPVARCRTELGWYWLAMKNGCCGSSMISTSPSREKPENLQPGVHHLLQVAVVEFVAMPVPLADDVGAVDRVRERAVRDPAPPARPAASCRRGSSLRCALRPCPSGPATR